VHRAASSESAIISLDTLLPLCQALLADFQPSGDLAACCCRLLGRWRTASTGRRCTLLHGLPLMLAAIICRLFCAALWWLALQHQKFEQVKRSRLKGHATVHSKNPSLSSYMLARTAAKRLSLGMHRLRA